MTYMLETAVKNVKQKRRGSSTSFYHALACMYTYLFIYFFEKHVKLIFLIVG
jgi:hypothetical protein